MASKRCTHGTIGLADAIKVSCDSFFYQYGNAAGIQSIDAVGKMLGIGEESGLQLSGRTKRATCRARSGCRFIIRRNAGRRRKRPTFRSARATLWFRRLQLAMAYVAVANGGTCYYPRLIDKVLNQDGTPVLDEQASRSVPPAACPLRFAARSFAEATSNSCAGLWKVVNEDGGTGGGARLKDVVVAGKTGTAQATDRGHEENVAWFACFAPFDHPKYVVAVMVQGASADTAARSRDRLRHGFWNARSRMDEGNSTCRSPGSLRRINPIRFKLFKSVSYHGFQ